MRLRAAAKSSRRAHHAPLPSTRRFAPRAGMLTPISAPPARPFPRHIRPRRTTRRDRRDLPRLFEDHTSSGEYAPRRLPLSYRQPSSGIVPPVPSSQPERRPRRESPVSREPSEAESAPVPEFALPDEDLSQPPSRPTSVVRTVEERASAYGFTSASGVYELYSAVDVAKDAPAVGGGAGLALRRKVLNTERYNNGARALRRDCRAQRVAVRLILACSGAFYALAFVAFYFLSLP